jgi:hypothetical protein
MSEIKLTVGDESYTATLLETKAPKSVEAVLDFLPLHSELMHVRWSGIATWINIDDIELSELPRENHTVYPSIGDLLLYPGYENEQEILWSCGPTCFKSPAGELAGNHFATVNASREELKTLEERTLADGTQDITIKMA